MPEPDFLMTEAEAAAHIDRILAEKFPDLYRKPDPAGDSLDKIMADPRLSWLFKNPNAKA